MCKQDLATCPTKAGEQSLPNYFAQSCGENR